MENRLSFDPEINTYFCIKLSLRLGALTTYRAAARLGTYDLLAVFVFLVVFLAVFLAVFLVVFLAVFLAVFLFVFLVDFLVELRFREDFLVDFLSSHLPLIFRILENLLGPLPRTVNDFLLPGVLTVLFLLPVLVSRNTSITALCPFREVRLSLIFTRVIAASLSLLPKEKIKP